MNTKQLPPTMVDESRIGMFDRWSKPMIAGTGRNHTLKDMAVLLIKEKCGGRTDYRGFTSMDQFRMVSSFCTTVTIVRALIPPIYFWDYAS